MKAGILVNPGSGRFRGRVELRRRLEALPSAGLREAADPAEVSEAVHAFAAAGIDLLVVVGGDGTVQMVLSCLFRERPYRTLPALAVVPAGTTNMTALDLGVHGRPGRVLQRLEQCLAAPAAARQVRRCAVRVRRPGCADIYGMFFGAGVIAGGVHYFQTRVRRLRITGEIASGLVILRFLAAFLFRRGAGILKPVYLEFGGRRGSMQDGGCMLLLVSSLDRLLLGMRPYWGREAAPLHVTWIRQAPARFWRSLPLLLSGRGERLGEAPDYASSNVTELDISMHDNFVVDGEIYPAGGPLHLDVSEPVVFLVP